ncbi:hypothetical protein [Mesorhizobium sp. ES1-1]|uniref:hypothetical protein n=1 Tax=Mesorhizobium sp. ES1-1 TaxID=2876629 RepID=UPI001CCD22BF|nr:hypothetical protein [Mesorhizobium sp. ES1-1]MBZ9675986.1 hypothetical protein [Mesorhizobium sp. ES1-1]
MSYEIGGAIVGFVFATVEFFLLRSYWLKPEFPTPGRGILRGVALFGFVFLPIVGWVQGMKLSGAL